MKAFLIVLIVRLVLAALRNKGNTVQPNEPVVTNRNVFHPAEFELR